MENFSGQSALSVYQDFHSKILLKNLVSVLALPVNDALSNSMTSRKYDYQINFTQAISKSKDVIALLFRQTTLKLIQLIESLQDIFLKTIEPIRPRRKYPRRHTVSCRKYFLNYKYQSSAPQNDIIIYTCVIGITKFAKGHGCFV